MGWSGFAKGMNFEGGYDDQVLVLLLVTFLICFTMSTLK